MTENIKKIDDGGPAFPVIPPLDENGRGGASGYPFADAGMSLRDHFAGQALGFGFDWTQVHETGGYAEAAQVAYEVADAMIAARSRG